MRTVYHEKLSELADQLGTLCGLGRGRDGARDPGAVASRPRLGGASDQRPRPDRGAGHACRRECRYIAGTAAAGGRRTAQYRQLGADRRRCGSDGRTGRACGQDHRSRHPDHVLPAEVERYFTEMGRVAVKLANIAQEALLTRDPDKAARIREQDDEMDELHRQLFTMLMDREWKTKIPPGLMLRCSAGSTSASPITQSRYEPAGGLPGDRHATPGTRSGDVLDAR